MRAVVVLLALAGVATACGGSGSVDPEPVAKAATKTTRARSYNVMTASTLTVPGASQRVTFKGTGGFDVARHQGKLALDFTPLAAVTGQNLGTMLIVLDGTTLYMKFPYLRQVAPGIKPWVKVDLEQTANAEGVAAFLQFGQGGDPTQTLEYLRGAGDVKKIGKEKVRGVATTHYSGTIELRKVPKTAAPTDRARVRRAIDRVIELTGQKTIPVDAWLDAHGRVRRMKYRQKMKIQNTRTEVAQKMELFDFGTPIAIRVPAPSEVTDLTELATGQEGR